MNKQLKLDVLCNDGSPLSTHYSDIYGGNGRIGLGGAELALHTLCNAWHDAGHLVRLYNNPSRISASPYHQYPLDTFIPKDDRDILIVFRSPNHRADNAKGKKIWLSCDQYTVGDFSEFSKKVDEIVCISQFHADYFRKTYEIDNVHVIDLPVRTQDYQERIEKIPHQMIFCSIPDRGLTTLALAYPRIKKEIKDASLVITSDYRLWGIEDARNEGHIKKFFGMDDVRFLGAVPRMELVKEQLLSDVQSYPCSYEELFCYAVAECQVAGAYPVTSIIGALETTNMGTQIGGNPKEYAKWVETFTDTLLDVMTNEHLPEMQEYVRQAALKRFSLDVVLGEWEKIFYA